jgi:two-component system vancomycin resistance associated response regulator VraR
MKKKIAIVEDQNMSRQLLESFIADNEQLELAGSFENGEEIIDYLGTSKVDLVVLDVVLGDGMNGLDTAEVIKKNWKEVMVIIITSMPEVSFIDRAKEIGVDSFWYKEVSKEPILAVIERTLAGELVYPDSTPVKQIGNITSDKLTHAELSVLREMTTGATDTEIAERLGLSVTTVRSHIRHMQQKTGYKNRVELAVKARILGIVIK